jgi:hypothetical protein
LYHIHSPSPFPLPPPLSHWYQSPPPLPGRICSTLLFSHFE